MIAGWVLPCLLHALQRSSSRRDEDSHLIFCIADHFEPKGGRATPDKARARLDKWLREYPRQFAACRDSDGRSPQHTFFYPIDEYEAEHVDALGELCRAGFGEVEMHLHHDGDTPSNLRQKLLEFKQILGEQHGLLARDRDKSELRYGFVHGNWALCNSRPDGRWCGVNEELEVLRETGCYADFTMPSAPHVTQSRKINSLYYAVSKPGRPRSHDSGVDLGTGPRPANSLLLIQGPLVFNWRKRKAGILPRLENGCVQNSQPATLARVANWMKARIQVPSRPDWFFVKLHAHGAEETSHDALLGEPMAEFRRDLAAHAKKNRHFHFHYVTAREMYNLVRAAEEGWKGPVSGALDYELVWNGALAEDLPETIPPDRTPDPAVPS
jgi:hypothetical protein